MSKPVFSAAPHRRGGSGELLPFTKMQSVGNDFVVIETTKWPEGTDWEKTAIGVCDRHFGVGSDGLMLFLPAESPEADFRMRMFNPDGTEDMCGNGLRCVIYYGYKKGLIAAQGIASTIAGSVKYAFPHGALPDRHKVITVFGAPRFAPADLPMSVSGLSRVIDFPLALSDDLTLTISTVSTGTTHTVIWTDELPDDDTFFHLSPLIENHPLFPERTSVMWARIDSPDTVTIRIWERGAGETLGCGTGAAAVAVLGKEEGRLTNGSVTIRSKGGQLGVEYSQYADAQKESFIRMSGEASIVFEGSISEDAEG